MADRIATIGPIADGSMNLAQVGQFLKDEAARWAAVSARDPHTRRVAKLQSLSDLCRPTNPLIGRSSRRDQAFRLVDLVRTCCVVPRLNQGRVIA